ncbi:MAG: hypothetical protein ACO3JJ_15080 [Opitutaceae bacterium]
MPSRLPRPLRRGLLILACVLGGLIAAVAQVRATTVNTFTTESSFQAATTSAGLVQGSINFDSVAYPVGLPLPSPSAPATFTDGSNAITAQTDGGLLSVVTIGLTSGSAGTSTRSGSYLVGFSGYPMNLSDFSFPALDPVYAVGGLFSLTNESLDFISGTVRIRLFDGIEQVAQEDFSLTAVSSHGYGDPLTDSVFLGMVSPVSFDRMSVQAVVDPNLQLSSGDQPWVGIASLTFGGLSTAPAPSNSGSSSVGAASVPDGGASLVMVGSAMFALAGAASRWRRRK